MSLTTAIQKAAGAVRGSGVLLLFLMALSACSLLGAFFGDLSLVGYRTVGGLVLGLLSVVVWLGPWRLSRRLLQQSTMQASDPVRISDLNNLERTLGVRLLQLQGFSVNAVEGEYEFREREVPERSEIEEALVAAVEASSLLAYMASIPGLLLGIILGILYRHEPWVAPVNLMLVLGALGSNLLLDAPARLARRIRGQLRATGKDACICSGLGPLESSIGVPFLQRRQVPIVWIGPKTISVGNELASPERQDGS